MLVISGGGNVMAVMAEVPFEGVCWKVKNK
jgi:hypothetical protein